MVTVAFCLVSSVFAPHPVWLSPWFHFPLPIIYREGGTCSLQWHSRCALKVSCQIIAATAGTQPSEDMPEPKVELSWDLFLCDRLNGNKDSGCHKALSETWECWEELSTQLQCMNTNLSCRCSCTCLVSGNNVIQNTCAAFWIMQIALPSICLDLPLPFSHALTLNVLHLYTLCATDVSSELDYKCMYVYSMCELGLSDLLHLHLNCNMIKRDMQGWVELLVKRGCNLLMLALGSAERSTTVMVQIHKHSTPAATDLDAVHPWTHQRLGGSVCHDVTWWYFPRPLPSSYVSSLFYELFSG